MLDFTLDHEDLAEPVFEGPFAKIFVHRLIKILSQILHALPECFQLSYPKVKGSCPATLKAFA